MDEITVSAPSDDIWFSARTTQLQFAALAIRCDPEAVISSLVNAPRTAVKGRGCDLSEVRRWLINGWSTEQLMRLSRSRLTGGGLKHSLHWAFPQAYYSAFAITLGFFKCVGYTEESHTAVKKKVGQLILEGRYPDALSFVGVGPRPCQFVGLKLDKLPTALHWVPSDPTVVDCHIRQFVNSTRRIDLDDRKRATKLTTKGGGRRKAFGPSDWTRVSEAIGPTSLLNLLYRKRIKANYSDIDTFLADNLDADQLYDNLIRIVASINLAHEALLLSALGRNDYETCTPNATAPFVRTRMRRLLRA